MYFGSLFPVSSPDGFWRGVCGSGLNWNLSRELKKRQEWAVLTIKQQPQHYLKSTLPFTKAIIYSNLAYIVLYAVSYYFTSFIWTLRHNQRVEFKLKLRYSGFKFCFSVLHSPFLRDEFSKEGKNRAKAAAWSQGYPQYAVGGRRGEDTISLIVTALSPALCRP